MDSKAILKRDDIMEFITRLYGGDLHAKRVLSLANATLGILASASLAIHAIGQGLAQALGKLGKHGVEQVDRGGRVLTSDGNTVEIDIDWFVANGATKVCAAGTFGGTTCIGSLCWGGGWTTTVYSSC